MPSNLSQKNLRRGKAPEDILLAPGRLFPGAIKSASQAKDDTENPRKPGWLTLVVAVNPRGTNPGGRLRTLKHLSLVIGELLFVI